MAGMSSVGRLAWRLLRDPKFQALVATAGPTVAARARELAKQGRWRQLAIVHADTVVEGRLARVPLDGEPHWVVWSAGEPVAAYPPYSGDLAEAVRTVDVTRLRKPEEMPMRSARRVAADRRRAAGELLRTRGAKRPPPASF